jgi:glycosyltransferase involved in cell wall biosynthesis
MTRRIFHGPVNICGIGRHLADAERARGVESDFITFRVNPIADESHECLNLRQYGSVKKRLVRLRFFFRCLLRYDVFHFYYGETLLPWNLDLPVLRLCGKRVFMTYCGSDVRLASIEKVRNPYWEKLCILADAPANDRAKLRLMRWHRLWIPRVIAPRSLFATASKVFPRKAIVKDVWVHNTIDLESYVPQFRGRGDVPVIVHAPSSRAIKGTQFVEQAVDALEHEGVPFRYLRIENRSHADTLRLIREEADIVVDQMFAGDFGTLAVEGMALGKPVVGYLLDEVRREHFPDIPMVCADIETLKDRLASLIHDAEERERLGRAGRAFVERHLDRREVADRILELY